MGNQESSSSSSPKSCLMKERYDYVMSLITPEDVSDGNRDTVEDDSPDLFNPADYVFPFENLVLEGGGCKGLAYCGAVKYLEDIDVMPQITRFAGTSAGAFAAATLAVGYNSDEMSTLLSQDLEEKFKDGSYFRAIQNLREYFGYHPGNTFEAWFGDILKKKTGSADITFDEVRKAYKRELCVVITDVNWMKPEYCHPKTTPDMPVRTAVRISMGIPGLFTAKTYTLFGVTDVFVDGGLTCNYPINCFDGWYLSMTKEDNFIERFLVGTDRREMDAKKFEPVNNKSLGFIVYADSEHDLLWCGLDHGKPNPEKPEMETKLSRERADEEKRDLKKSENVHRLLKEAAATFLKVLEKYNLDEDVIDRGELESALNDDSFTDTYRKMLFGEENDVFNYLDHNRDGKIDHDELVNFIGELGIPLHNWSVRYRRRDVPTFGSFVKRLINTLLMNTAMVNVKHTDVDRTVAINTGYVGTTDFDMEDADKAFVRKRGYNACKTYFQHFIETNKAQRKESSLPMDHGEETSENTTAKDVNMMQ